MAHGLGTSDDAKIVDSDGAPVVTRGEVGNKAIEVSSREILAAIQAQTAVLVEIRDLILRIALS